MLKIGIEEPMDNNKSLHKRNLGFKILSIDNTYNPNLNRYTFVAKGVSQNDYHKIIVGLLSQLGDSVTLLVAWKSMLPGKSKVASLVKEKKYLKNGWVVKLRQGHYVALKRIDLDTLNKDWIPEIDFKNEGFVIFKSDTIEETIKFIDEESTYFLSESGYFAPSDKVVESLESYRSSLFYTSKDELGNPGGVLITPKKINARNTLSKFEEKIECYSGESAYKVFI